jgi:hypothetical protein
MDVFGKMIQFLLVDMVTENCNINGNVPTLIKHIRNLKNMNWQVEINHTGREGNRSTDWLTNFSFTLNSFDLYFIETPPKDLRSLLFEDMYGLACLRVFV